MATNFPSIWVPKRQVWVPPTPDWRKYPDPLWYPEKRAPVYAAISFNTAGTAVTATSGSVTLLAPAGTASSDVVLAGFHYLGGSGVTITPPSGWTLVPGSRLDNGTTSGTAIYWALGSVASYAFTISGNTKTVGFTLGYIGVDNTTPMDATATAQTNASSATGTAPSITTVTANAWVVCFFGFDSASTFTDTSPLVHRQSIFLGGGGVKVSLDGADFPTTTAGATAAQTTTASIAAVSEGITVALRPVVAAVFPRRPLINLSQAVSRASIF
jgi:hypothetical protein